MMQLFRQWWQRLIAPIDPTLMLFTGILFTVAFLAVLSASPERVMNQLMNTAIALLVMRVLAQIPPQRLMHLAPPIFLGGVFLLVCVALFGDISKGARRWLNLGF